MTISFQYDCLFWRFWGGCLIMQVSTQWKYDFQWRKKIFTYEYLVYQTKQMFYLFHSFYVFFVAQNDFITHELQINILVFAIELYLNSRLTLSRILGFQRLTMNFLQKTWYVIYHCVVVLSSYYQRKHIWVAVKSQKWIC